MPMPESYISTISFLSSFFEVIFTIPFFFVNFSNSSKLSTPVTAQTELNKILSKTFFFRSSASKLENNLLNWSEIEKLSANDKMYLYKLLSGNMTNSLTFLQKLHSSLAEAVESLTSMDKLKRDQVHEETMGKDDRVAIGELRSLLLEKIKEKTKQIGGTNNA